MIFATSIVSFIAGIGSSGVVVAVPDADSTAIVVARVFVSASVLIGWMKDMVTGMYLQAGHDKLRINDACCWFFAWNMVPALWLTSWLFCSRNVTAEMVIQFRRARRKGQIPGYVATALSVVAAAIATFVRRNELVGMATTASGYIVNATCSEVLGISLADTVEAATRRSSMSRGSNVVENPVLVETPDGNAGHDRVTSGQGASV